MKNLNAQLLAKVNEKGFIELSILPDGWTNTISIKINDFGGTQKKSAKAISYKLVKMCEGK